MLRSGVATSLSGREAGGGLPCGPCTSANKANSSWARRRRPPSGTQGTASATERCGADGPTGGSSPRSPTSPRAGRSTSVVAKVRTRSGSARRGWTVTAIDISDVAVCRAREAAELAGATVEWVCGNALQKPFPARGFDLVSMQYPALPKAAGDTAVRGLLGTVRPGGLLLAVYHDLDDEHCEHMKSQGLDPANYVAADDLSRLLSDDFTVELHTAEPRIDAPPGTPHVDDVVLRARRR